MRRRRSREEVIWEISVDEAPVQLNILKKESHDATNNENVFAFFVPGVHVFRRVRDSVD
jgi:hypothetical protein